MAGFNLQVEISQILDAYDERVKRAVEEAAEEAANLTANMLKETSPARTRGKGKGKYKRGWKVKRLEQGLVKSYVVYNGAAPGLTQLLEYGHVSRNQYGSWGRVRAIPHIGDAAEAGIQRFELGVRARLR